ncbi:MAG TPA: tryptophan synthase subunit alpha, partial [Thermoanaerobaculia bacterium]|nr:tryptophan synthase subunit alpha [Thermoanaerobaculia bacterium]
MDRIKSLFRKLHAQNRCGLIAYVTCGDPDRETTVRIVEELERAGADAIELGVPFSDPIADGPVIQAAAQRALNNGTSIRDVFDIAKAVRAKSAIPLIAFSYFNPVMRFGADPFGDAAKDAGIDSVLLTDLPPEASQHFRAAMHERGLGTIFLLAPTTRDDRVTAIDRASDGFVYYVSTTGVTGTRRELDPALIARL